MSELIVGISDLKVSKNPGDVLITYALGSCIAVAVYDPKARVGGLLHFMLPDSSLDANKAKAMPMEHKITYFQAASMEWRWR